MAARKAAKAAASGKGGLRAARWCWTTPWSTPYLPPPTLG